MHARFTKRLRRTPVFHNDFAHHTLRIASALAHVSRRRYETEIAQTIFDAAQTAVAVPVKIDFAMSGIAARVLQMSFESNEGRASNHSAPPGSFFSLHTTGKLARPARSINRNQRTELTRAAILFKTHAPDAPGLHQKTR